MFCATTRRREKTKENETERKKEKSVIKINTEHSIDVIQSTNVSGYLKSIKNGLLWSDESAKSALMLYN